MTKIFINIFLSAKRDGVHKEFQKAIEAAVCRYVPEKGVLSVMVILHVFIKFYDSPSIHWYTEFYSHATNPVKSVRIFYKICISAI